ncbi:MAG: hypothetical protein WAP25_00385, partial [Ilumatobacteraceae bacterium]
MDHEIEQDAVETVREFDQIEIGNRFERNEPYWKKLSTIIAVAGPTLFLLMALHPELILRNNTPTGGDMGAHVWGPAFLRDHLLTQFKL